MNDPMFTLNATEHHAVCYGVSSYDSNGMKSTNPHSGFYEAQTSRTLDLNGGNPACNQGGVLVVERNDPEALVFKERAGKPGGKGILIGEDRAFTLATSTDEAVCYVPTANHCGSYAEGGWRQRFKQATTTAPAGTRRSFSTSSTRRTPKSRKLRGVSPTVTVKWAKGSCDTPLVVTRTEEDT